MFHYVQFHSKIRLSFSSIQKNYSPYTHTCPVYLVFVLFLCFVVLGSPMKEKEKQKVGFLKVTSKCSKDKEDTLQWLWYLLKKTSFKEGVKQIFFEEKRGMVGFVGDSSWEDEGVWRSSIARWVLAIVRVTDRMQRGYQVCEVKGLRKGNPLRPRIKPRRTHLTNGRLFLDAFKCSLANLVICF